MRSIIERLREIGRFKAEFNETNSLRAPLGTNKADQLSDLENLTAFPIKVSRLNLRLLVGWKDTWIERRVAIDELKRL